MHKLKWLWKWMRTHKKFSIPAAIVVVILVLILKPKPAPSIATTTVNFGNITQTVSVSGTIAAKKSINLTFPIGGTLSWIGVQKGSSVSAYQTIATLDQRTAQHNLQAALITYSKQRNTFDQNIVNNNNIANPQDALNDNMKRILQNNQYDLNAAVNSVELADLARQQSILTTPISGIVTRADITVAGTTAIAGTTTFTVTDPTSVVFDMDVDEADVSKVQAGQIAQITLDPYPDTVLKLPVDSIDFVSHTTSNGGNAYTVETKLPENALDKYRVGMDGNADIVTAQKSHVLIIPLSSLDPDNNVYVKSGKKYVKKKVTLGLQSDTQAEVISGLLKGDVVAMDPTTVINNKLVASGTK